MMMKKYHNCFGKRIAPNIALRPSLKTASLEGDVGPFLLH